jgi:hypothetical protein
VLVRASTVLLLRLHHLRLRSRLLKMTGRPDSRRRERNRSVNEMVEGVRSIGGKRTLKRDREYEKMKGVVVRVPLDDGRYAG